MTDAFDATIASGAGDVGTTATLASGEVGGGLAAIVGAQELPVVDRASYEMLEEFARGGLGRIVRARDRRTGRVVAIKEMLGTADETARRFAREARVTANLQHPAIVPVYELGRWPTGEPFYAMKLVAGRSLEAVLDDARTLPGRLARLANVVAVAEALAYAHGRRVIHRDLKPANVLVGDFGETVVIDWGLAKVIGTVDEASAARDDADLAAMAPDRTVDGAVLGTPSYMPPEQATGDAADERADVYAIGAMLYHLISGAPPFADQKVSTLGDLLAKVSVGAPTPLGELEPTAPRDLVTIVGKAMARNPADRYPSARELADDLRRFTNGQLVSAHRYDRRTLVVRWLRRHRAAVTVAAILTVVLAVGAVVSVRRIVAERDAAEGATLEARTQNAKARESLATALFQKGRAAEETQHWSVAAMYYAAARVQHDTPTARWAAGIAGARAMVASSRHLGHAGAVMGVAVSPDGTRAASVDAGGELHVWARDTGALVGKLVAPTPLWAVAWSPDGTELAYAGDDGIVRRATPALAAIAELPGHAKRVWAIAYAPDGKTIATASEDTTIRLWSRTDASAPPRVFAGHTQRVYAVAWSPDGTRLASSSDDREVWAWNVARGTGAKIGSHEGGGVRAVVFVPGAIVSTGWDYVIKVWPDDNPPEVWSDTHSVHAMVASADGRLIATAGDSGEIHLWETHTHQLIAALAAPGGRTNGLAITRDGRWLVAAGREPVVWDLAAVPRAIDTGHTEFVNQLELSPDETQAVSLDNHSLRVWDVATGAQLRAIPTGEVWCNTTVAMLRDGSLVAACRDLTFRRWAPDGRETLRLHTELWLAYGAVSPDERTFLGGHMKGQARTIDLATNALGPLHTLADHQIYAVRYAANGRAITAGLDSKVRVWEPDLAPVATFAAHTNDGLLAAAISEDGALVASGGEDGSVEVWDLATQKQLARFAAHAETIWNMRFAGGVLFTVAEDGTIRRWSTTTWQAIGAPLDAGERAAISLAVTRDGRTAIAGYRTGAIVIWDVATGTVRHRAGGRAREHGSCEDVAAQQWVDAAHHAMVAAACASSPEDFLATFGARSHQRIDHDVDVVPSW